MKVRLKRAWSAWSKGHVFPEMPGGQARVLIGLGTAEEIVDPPASRRAFKAPVDRAVRRDDLLIR
jgi:hypothetical protein